jgi:hypothetical protein
MPILFLCCQLFDFMIFFSEFYILLRLYYEYDINFLAIFVLLFPFQSFRLFLILDRLLICVHDTI